jgi:hypothetical protein
MGRSSDKGTRIDVLIGNDVFEAVQLLAVQSGARIHHISKKVETSPTIAKLVELGLDALKGILPDSIGNVSDNLSGTLSSALSDTNINISDKVSDKMVEAIVDRRLKDLGLFPDYPATDNHPLTPIESIFPFLSDKVESVPDIVPDKDVIISDKDALLPDNLPDTQNILSDDSSNSESIAEDVQVIPTDATALVARFAFEQVSGEVPTSFSFGGFHDWLGLTRTARNKVNGDIAIDFARSQGRGEWVMSKSYKITKQSENN